MALNYGIFESEFVGLDSNNVPMYDRAVDETFLELYCGGFFTDGIAVFVENCFQVISELNNQITINPGIALLEGKMAYDLLSDTIGLPDSPTTYSRYDRVVLRRDNVARLISIEFISGAENAAPVEPDLTRTENVYELSLATILRSPSDTVTQANITDDRLNTSLCGVIAPKTNVLNTEALFAQFTAVFNEWFNGTREILTTDVAGSLLAKIEANTTDIVVHTTAISNLKKFQTAGGTGTAITLTDVELTDSFQTTFIIVNSNNGSSTTINGKHLYKPGTVVSPKLNAGKAATVWYNLAGDCFFIKASAEGTATAGDVLAGQTFSNDDDTGLTGTLALTGTTDLADVYSGKTFYKDNPKTKLTGMNPYKAGVKVPFNKLKPAAPIQIVSLDATSGTANERMSIVFVTSDGYSFMIQYNGSNYVNVYNKDGVFLSSFSFSAAAIYDFVIYDGYIYAFNDARVEKYSVNAGFTTITSVASANIVNDYNRVKRIGDYVYYVKSSYMFNLNLNTLGYTQMIYKAGLSKFYAVDINNYLWGGNGYYTNVFKYDTAGNLILTLSLSTALYASPSYMSIDYSAARGTMIFICFKEVSGVRKYFLLEYSLSGTLLNSVDLYTLYGIGGSASLYVDTYFGISNGLILFSCEKRLVAIKESDLSLVTRLQAGSFDCTETKAILNGDYITGSMGNVHFCSSLVAELQ